MRLKLTGYSVGFFSKPKPSQNGHFLSRDGISKPTSVLLLAACAVLTACGGGGSADPGPVQASVTPPVTATPPVTPPVTAPALASYPGTWYGPCLGRMQDVATVSMAGGAGNALLLKLVRNFHGADGCGGTPIATETLSADFTLTWDGTKTTAALLTPSSAAVQVTLDLVTITIPPYTRTRGGPAVTATLENGVRGWCINYSDGPVCTVDAGPQAAANAPAALYLDKGELVLLSPSGTAGYSVDARYTKDRAATPQGQGPAFQRIDTVQGTGTLATSGRTLTVHYTGWLYDAGKADFRGAQFDTSVGKTPFSFRLGAGQVIGGWDQGLLGMRAGGKRTLIIPAALAYGRAGSGTSIPPDAPLIFDVELISVQ